MNETSDAVVMSGSCQWLSVEQASASLPSIMNVARSGLQPWTLVASRQDDVDTAGCYKQARNPNRQHSHLRLFLSDLTFSLENAV